MESQSAAAGPVHVAPKAGDKGLKTNAIGFVDGLIIGVASTAPAYSLAAVIGIIVVGVGVQAPGVLLASFVPMFLIAGAFYYMNRADPDCGTSFSWITRAMGPSVGWVAGWAVCTTGILVIGSLADIAAFYIYDLLTLTSLQESKAAVTLLAIAIIVVMTAICVLGTELSARVQRVLIGFQVVALLVFGIVALVTVLAGNGPAGSIDPAFSWVLPWEVAGFEALVLGLLTGVFIYWGWESAVNLNEETEGSDTAPGRAGVASTVILLFTYLLVAFGVLAYAGVDGVSAFEDDVAVLGAVADDALGWASFIVIIAIITSGIASTQTTILPASRTMLSMARQGAMPAALGKVHPRFKTPHVTTIVIGIVAVVWYAGLNTISQNFLFDSITALAIVIAFYYSLTGFACAIYYRRELTKSVKNFLFIGVAPVLGGTILAGLFGKAVYEYSQTDNSYFEDPQTVFGLAIPAAIGLGLLVSGVVLMVVWRLLGNERYFGRGRETVDPDVAAGRRSGVAAVPEEAV